MKTIVTGATGFLGRALCSKLVTQKQSVIALTRDPERAKKRLGAGVTCLAWEQDSDAWQDALNGADTVFHLAGESVAAQRWTPDFKQSLLSSRVDVTHRLVDALCKATPRPRALISASAVGYYGDRSAEILNEESLPGNDFLGTLCQQWEAEVLRAEACGIREVRVRLGIVLGDGGSLEKMLYPLPLPLSPWKMGLGGRLGSGKQWFPWIHVEDVVGMLLWSAENPNVRGAVNAVAPHPVTNADFTRALGRVLHRPALFPVPAFALRALLGEFAQVLLGGQRVIPAVAQQLGYAFQYEDIERALENVVKKKG